MDQSRYHETIMVRIQEHCQSCIGEVEAQTHMLLYELCYISHQYPGRNINNLFMYIFEIKKTTTTILIKITVSQLTNKTKGKGYKNQGLHSFRIYGIIVGRDSERTKLKQKETYVSYMKCWLNWISKYIKILKTEIAK